MPPAQTIHKQGYLFKQGSYLPSWNERYFSLETSLLKQFADAETPIPSYSLYLGSAAVAGIFSASQNEDLGYGLLWSFVIRWPLPAASDMVEEQWGYMHIGSYDQKEADEWFDTIEALIRVEQTKRLFMNSSFTRDFSTRTPPDFLPIPPGNQVTRLSFSYTVQNSIPYEFTNAYHKLITDFNQGLSRWTLVDASQGLLRNLKEDNSSWKFSVDIPAEKASAQKIWEILGNPDAAAWEPFVKHAFSKIENSVSSSSPLTGILSDKWTMRAHLRIGRNEEGTLTLNRVGFRDPESRIYIFIGLPDEDQQNSFSISSLAWTVEPVNESTCILTSFISFTNGHHHLPLSSLEEMALAVFRASVIRIKEFILSQ